MGSEGGAPENAGGSDAEEPVSRKRCTRCEEVKPLEEFHRNKNTQDGLTHTCKVCNCRKSINWYRDNREQAVLTRRAYYEANREEVRRKSDQWAKANSERVRRYVHEWYFSRRDDELIKRREWYEANRDRIRTHRRENRPKRRSYEAARRALKRSLPSETVLLRDVACRDGANCWMCGDELSEWNPAHLDHLIPLAADVDQLAAWGVENPGTVLANMALACPSCNIRKRDRIMLCAVARYLQNLDAESEIAA